MLGSELRPVMQRRLLAYHGDPRRDLNQYCRDGPVPAPSFRRSTRQPPKLLPNAYDANTEAPTYTIPPNTGLAGDPSGILNDGHQ